jgi:ABC-type multidrug transport system fused ATPase/permease subunit
VKLHAGAACQARLDRFLDTLSKEAPWFLEEGYINQQCWECLGRDLRASDMKNPLPVGCCRMLAIWNLVRACLRDASGKYNAEIEEGAEVLEEIKEIASRASRRKSKQLRQQTKDRKRRRNLALKGLLLTAMGLFCLFVLFFVFLFLFCFCFSRQGFSV